MHDLCRGTCLLFCIGNNLIGGDVFFARARALLRERRREEEKRERERVSEERLLVAIPVKM